LKKRKKQKPSAKDRALAAEWERIVKASAKPLERGAKAKGVAVTVDPKTKAKKVKALKSMPHVTGYERVAPVQAAKSAGDKGGVATKAKDKVYTGTAMLGVATMHKSNSVPVFQAEDAKDIAKMRR